jgi:hypothetical protein
MEATKAYLVREVVNTWGHGNYVRGDATRLAHSAVHEVVTALRANPAWCRALGLVPSEAGSS